MRTGAVVYLTCEELEDIKHAPGEDQGGEKQHQVARMKWKNTRDPMNEDAQRPRDAFEGLAGCYSHAFEDTLEQTVRVSAELGTPHCISCTPWT